MSAKDRFDCIFEIWAVKLRFLLTYEYMLKKIAVACSECTEKHKNADHVVPDLSDSLAMIENR